MNVDYNTSIDCDSFYNIIIRKDVSSNEHECTINNKLSYSILLDNVSGLNLYDVYIIEDLIGGLVYVTNSLRVNGVIPRYGDINLNETAVIPLGSISAANPTTLITFDVIIKNLPTQVPISNFSRVLYKLNSIVKILNSNMVYSNFYFKPMNKEFINLVDGSTITNKGLDDLVNFKILLNPSIDMNNVCIEDYINESIEIINIAIERNGISSNISCSNNILIPLGCISKNDSVIIHITGKILGNLNELSSSIILNQASLNYTTSYTKQNISYNSNPVYVYIYKPYVNSSIVANKYCVSINDSIEYTIILENFGTVPLLDLQLIDILPKSLEYIDSSAYIQYDNMPCTSVSYNPLTGVVPIGILDIGESVSVCVNAKVVSIPANPSTAIINSASIKYQYLQNPNSINNKYIYIEENIKDIYHVHIKSADLLSTFKKIITHNYNCECKQIDYELIFTNTGNISASNINITDILSNANFINESISVTTNKSPGNKNYLGTLPSITIDKVVPQETITIRFSVLPHNNLEGKYVTNYAKMSYYYSGNDNTPIQISGNSNSVSTLIESPKIDSILLINDSENSSRFIDDDSLFTTPNISFSNEILSYCSQSNTECIINPIQSIAPGDRVTFKMTVSNLSNQPITNLILADTLPLDATYVTNSLKINGVYVPYNFSSNLIIGDLPPYVDNTKTIEFDVILVTVPSSNMLINNACVSYDYIVSPSTYKTKTSILYDSTNTPVVYADLLSNFKKYVDKVGQTESYVTNNATISYIFKLENIGNATASNVILLDTIPSELEFLKGSIQVDPTLPNGSILEPSDGQSLLKINFGTMPPNKSYTIKFDTLSNFDVSSEDIVNTGNLSYSYTADYTTKSVIGNSNTVVSHVRHGNVILEKSSNYSEVNINVPITYTIVAKNLGNTTVNNLYIDDLLPPSLKYIPETLLLDGLPTKYDINSGVLVGSLDPFDSSTNSPLSTISFNALASTTPDYNPIVSISNAQYTFVSDPIKGTEVFDSTSSNQALVDVIAADIRSSETTKESSKLILTKLDSAYNYADYTITLKNNGNLPASNVVVQDTLPNDLTYNYQQPLDVIGVKSDGSTINVPFYSIDPTTQPNIVDGILVSTIPAGLTIKVKFGYIVNQNANDIVNNIGNYSYNYFVNNTTISKSYNTTKATIFTVENAFKVEKLATPESVCPPDAILYTVKATNITDSTIPNVILQDTLPSGVTLNPGTFTLDFVPFTINGSTITQSDLSLGINIGTIAGGVSKIVQYQASVTGNNIPSLLLSTSTIGYTSTINNHTIHSNIVSNVAAVNVPSTCPISKPYDNWYWNPCNSSCNCCTFNNPNICACCVNRNSCNK